MNINYYIGIGGTGARLAEALVHLCAAGLGPEKLHLFLVDPDQANGNLARTLELIDLYQKCHEGYRNKGSMNHQLFRTKIVTPPSAVWAIFDREDMKLSEYVNLDNLSQGHPAYAEFIRLLFTEQELETQLDEGFRGHPSIGAVTMANIPEDKEPWKTFWEDIETCQERHQARVFLAGSIFGGTGAAGIPTFGAEDVIKFNRKADYKDGTSKVQLGAALVLPYFRFDIDPDADEKEPMFVTAADFPIATKAALQFYSEKKLAFDDMYFVGDSLSQNVGSFSAGSKTQRNAPHYAEIAGALAARDFFAQPRRDELHSETNYYIAAREAPTVDWDALPSTREPGKVPTEREVIKRRLATTTAFFHTLGTYGQSILEASPKSIKDAWYKRNFGNRRDPDPRDPSSRAVVDDVTKYGQTFLAWITAIGEADQVELVDGTHIVSTGDGDAGESDAIELKDPQLHENSLGAFLQSVKSAGRTFAGFRTDIDKVEMKDKSLSASDRYLNIFHRAAGTFCQTNYNFDPEG